MLFVSVKNRIMNKVSIDNFIEFLKQKKPTIGHNSIR